MDMFQLDPLADLDAFINQMNAEMTDLGRADPIDWNEFLVDPMSDSDSDLPSKKTAPIVSEPVSPMSNASPKSTESESSLSLDVNEKDDMFDLFNFGIPDGQGAGIMHSVEDLPAYNTVPDIGMGVGAVNGGVNVTDLGLADFIAKFANAATAAAVAPAQPLPQVDLSNALQQAYAGLGWSDAASPAAPAQATAVQPAQLSLTASPSPVISSAPSLKRKGSEDSLVDASEAPTKRPRGRPPKTRADSTSSPLASATPLVRAGSVDSDADAHTTVKRTASGKPSTARPKSVVPEKYFKDGTAQQITGMTMDQILAFPTFEELLKAVKPELQAGASEFGERIAENRDKAKDAAKKSREERKAKVESLESTIEGLEGKIKGMQGVLMGLVARGVLGAGDVQAFM